MVKFEELFKINGSWHLNTTITVVTKGNLYFETTANICALFNPKVLFLENNSIVVNSDDFVELREFDKKWRNK